MRQRLLAVSLCLLGLIASLVAQAKSKKAAAPAPDKAFLQQFWDGWSSLNTANVDKFYAAGPGTFFDITPLKYSSWEDYKKGSDAMFPEYKSAKFTLNDDVAIHPHADLTWVTATVAYEMTTKGGKVAMGNFRWTAVFENQNGKWLVVHEHVSAPTT